MISTARGISKTAGLFAGVALLSQLALPGVASAAAPVPCSSRSMESVNLETLNMDVTTPAKTYRPGQKVLFDFTVTRPAGEDPLGQGIPMPQPTVQPAEGVMVGVGLAIEDVYLWGIGTTDAAGKSTITVKLPKYVKPGVGHVRALAQKKSAESPCLTVVETAYAQLSSAFKVGK